MNICSVRLLNDIVHVFGCISHAFSPVVTALPNLYSFKQIENRDKKKGKKLDSYIFLLRMGHVLLVSGLSNQFISCVHNKLWGFLSC